MESRNRTVWIVIIGVLLIACCCALTLGAGAVGWLTTRYADAWEEPLDFGTLQRERVEKSFEIGRTPELEISNFAGAVTIRRGEEEVVRVIATKKASSQDRLDRIEVDMNAGDERLTIRTRKLFDTGNASVELEITAPAGTRVSVDTGAGEVRVHDITGQIDIHSGAGSVDVRGAQDTTRIQLGAGEITYEGTPSGSCRFETGAGEIILRLPRSPDVRIDAGSGIGDVDVDFDVDGHTSPRSVYGVIGDGGQGSVYAHTGVGSVRVRRR
jgi:hypothetical protein